VYGIVGYAPEARWSSYQATAERAQRSFQPLTDPAALNVQPHHVDIVTMVRSTTIAQLVQERSSPVGAATLALINQVELQTPFASGRLVKWVIGL
jgi:predicted Zn-dependent protease